MSIKLSETQLALLSAASQREDRPLTPLKGPRFTLARKAAAKRLEAGLVREVKAKKDTPVWTRDEDTGCDCALKLTAAGLKAITAAAEAGNQSGAAPEPVGEAPVTAAASNVEFELVTNHAAGSDSLRADAGGAVSSRAGTKIAAVIALLGRAEGATINELVAATSWLPPTTRAALTDLRKRRFSLISDR